GGVALALTAQALVRVRALVLEGAAAYPPSVPLVAQLGLMPLIGGVLFHRACTRGQFAFALRRFAYGAGHPVSDEAVDYWWERFCCPGGKAAAHIMFHLMTRLQPLVDRVRGIAVPALVVWGETDALQPLANGRRLARELGAPLRMVPCTGHTPHEERSEAFLQIVAPFLGQAL